MRLSALHPIFKDEQIRERFAAFAGLAHDLGHPPFGHNGERALDDAMKAYGGFEGNAQTLRIIGRLEKKEPSVGLPVGVSREGKDNRVGLNLCYRSLASVLKYDEKIPKSRSKIKSLVKGYYDCDKDLVSTIKEKVSPGYKGKFRTIECWIMDLADDIAYSTYDLEDTFKLGFLSPLKMLSASDEILEKVAIKVKKSTGISMTSVDVFNRLNEILVNTQPNSVDFSKILGGNIDEISLDPDSITSISVLSRRNSDNYADNGYLRSSFTADLISTFISGVELEPNFEFPSMSKALFDHDTLLKVETIKHFTYEATIMSPRLKMAEHRGYEIVETIFLELAGDRGYLLLPDDARELHERFSKDDFDQKRVICDFIAGMTDKYALEFYARLRGENAQTIFKPT